MVDLFQENLGGDTKKETPGLQAAISPTVMWRSKLAVA